MVLDPAVDLAEAPVEEDLADRGAELGAARLAGRRVRDAALGERPRDPLEMGRLAAAVEAFEGDEERHEPVTLARAG